jgi:formylmethanofuran dehydrogenase subunit B
MARHLHVGAAKTFRVSLEADYRMTASLVSCQPVVCPFCGLLCDDLPAWDVQLQATCPRAADGVAALAGPGEGPRIDGAAASLAEAIGEAARCIGTARRPVIGGLGGDVQMMRAVLQLADRIGARVVHRNQFVVQRNLFAQQSRGAINTTLAEVRNRADLIVIVGGDPTRAFPRLLERLLVAEPAFVAASERRVVLLAAPPPERMPEGVAVDSVDRGGLDLFATVAQLRALVQGAPVMACGDLAKLATRMQACRYGTLIWAAADFDFVGADLLIEQLQQLTFDLNRKTRWAALPLAGSNGDLTANSVAAWQTGFALPIEFAAGKVDYDPFPDYSDADLLLWVGALPGVGSPQLPGADALPVVAIGAPSQATGLPARHVFIPVTTPGVTGSGHLVRCDNVITLYAPASLATTLPSAATVIAAIAEALGDSRS